MKQLLIISLVSMSFSVFSQSDSLAEAVVHTFFKAMYDHDTLTLGSLMDKQCVMASCYYNKLDESKMHLGDRQEFIDMIAKNQSMELDERVSNIQVSRDRNLAHVWMDYEFWLDGKKRHCGVNSFTLFWNGTAYVIVYLIDTQSRDC